VGPGGNQVTGTASFFRNKDSGHYKGRGGRMGLTIWRYVREVMKLHENGSEVGERLGNYM